ncbi:hypothetical protein QTP88_028391 [Uroleucon formosanum]
MSTNDTFLKILTNVCCLPVETAEEQEYYSSDYDEPDGKFENLNICVTFSSEEWDSIKPRSKSYHEKRGIRDYDILTPFTWSNITVTGKCYITVRGRCVDCGPIFDRIIEDIRSKNARVMMKCIYSGNFNGSHKKRKKLMGSAKEKTIISVIDKGIASSVYTRREANVIMLEVKSKAILSSRLHDNPIIALGIYKRNSYSKVHPVTISFDATGGVCKKIKRYDNQLSGVVFLYEGVMNLFGKSFTVLSMLSEQRDNVSISLWLKRWLRCSLPLMSGIVQAFTQYNSLEKYLKVCFLILSSNIKPKIPTCFVRNDINHFIHLVTQWSPKELFSRSMGLLVYSTNMIEAKQILEAMFIVAFSPSDDKIIDTKMNSLHVIVRRILREKFRGKIEEFNFIRSFKEWTKSISNRCKIKIQGIQGIGDNAQFEIELETYIVNAMKLFPCWSSIMVSSFGNGDPTVSSSRVESNFNQLKNRLYKQQVMPLRVDTFIQEILPYYRATLYSLTVHINHDFNTCSQSEQELYAIVHTSTLLLSSHTFNEDNVYSNSVVLDEHSYKCLMCENGDLRTGMHRYRLCKKALHLFGCSVPANQTKEDCGEARICLESKSYFNKQPTFEHVVFNKKGLFKPIIHLKNGSSLCHKPILIPGTRKLVFSNTYSADSLLSILACSSAADSIGYKKILTHAKVINNTAQFILKMITQSSLKNIYKERALLLLNNFDNNMQVLVGGLKQLNIIGTIKKVAEKLIEEFPFYRRINERTDYLCENVSTTETSSTIIYLNVFHGHIDLEREILHFYLLISKVYTVPKCVCGTKLDMAPERGKKSPSTVAAKGDADEC